MDKDTFHNSFGCLLLAGAILLFICAGCAAPPSANPPTSSPASQAPLPDISDIQANGITSTSAVITWTAGHPLSGLIEWGKSTDYEFNQSVSGQPGIQQPIILSGLRAGTTYYYRLNLKAQNGDPVISAEQSFSTLESFSSKPLQLSEIHLSIITSNTAVIAWTSDEPATGQVEYGTSTSYGDKTATEVALSQDHSIDLKQLSPNTTYHYRVLSQNKSGSEAVSIDYEFTTADPSDYAPPDISDIEIIDITHESATITWITNELATSQVEYDTGVSYANTTPLYNCMAYRHSVTLSSLDNSKTYYFRIKTADWNGNTALSDGATFVTYNAPRVLGTRTHQHTDCRCSSVQ
ncbi:MAG: fibronectin type III domain-containing protein [Dehalococcoidia bacterium]|nr:fibronectin type III domain-containing protein [Dehalococcoidia bacterium]